MIIKGIGSTTHLDKHNCRMTKDALVNFAESINSGKRAVSVGIEHDLSIPPIGKVIKAEIIEFEDKETGIYITEELFEKRIKISHKDEDFIKTYSEEDSRGFVLDESKEVSDKFEIGYDMINFQNKIRYDLFSKELNEISEYEEKIICRKALISDPVIIITLTKSVIVLLGGKKLLDKVSIDVQDDISKLYRYIKKLVVNTVKYMIPQNRPITYLFKSNGNPNVEFIIISNNANIILNSLSEEKISLLYSKASDYKNSLNAEKIQFILDDAGVWQFNFLLTQSGEVIGSERTFNRSDKRFKEMEIKKRESEVSKSINIK